MNRPRYATAVLGGGAVGLIAALGSARRAATVLVLRSKQEPKSAPRIETVPAPTLSLLIDFGVHPRRIGVDRLHEDQHMAWRGANPEWRRGHAMAHIDKARLEAELFRLVAHTPHLDIVIDPQAPSVGRAGWRGSLWSARRLIDATGRAAATAARRICAPKPWVARPFWSATPAPASLRDFRIAALPDGYVYRVGSSEADTLWLAGRGALLSAGPGIIQAAIQQAGGGWLLEGLPPLSSLHRGRAFPVSVQWAEGSTAIAVGDAALARDALSSQGMAAGLSSACYAAAVESAQDEVAFRAHQRAECAHHLQSLAQLIRTCRYGDCREWRRYGSFVVAQPADATSPDPICLSQGRVTPCHTVA